MSGGTGRSGAAFPPWLGQGRAWLCLQQGLAVPFSLLPLLALKDSLENGRGGGRKKNDRKKENQAAVLDAELSTGR